MAIVNVQYVKQALGITDTSEDAKLAILVDVADATIKNFCNCDFEQATYGGSSPTSVSNGIGDSGYYSGDDSEYLILRQRPVTDIVSVYVDATGRFGDNPDGAFASSTLLTEGTDYVLQWDATLPGSTTRCSKSGILERIGSVWPGLYRYQVGSINPKIGRHKGNIKISYTAGYTATTIPPDLKYAATLIISKMRQTAYYGGDQITHESYEDYSYKLGGSSGGASAGILGLHEVRSILSRYRDVSISA